MLEQKDEKRNDAIKGEKKTFPLSVKRLKQEIHCLTHIKRKFRFRKSQ